MKSSNPPKSTPIGDMLSPIQKSLATGSCLLFVGFVAGGLVHKILRACAIDLAVADNVLLGMLIFGGVVLATAGVAYFVNRAHCLSDKYWWIILYQGFSLIGLGIGYFEFYLD